MNFFERTGQGLGTLRAAIAEIASSDALAGTGLLPELAVRFDGSGLTEPHDDHAVSEHGH